MAAGAAAAATTLLMPDRWWLALVAAATTAALVGRDPARRSPGERKIDSQVTAMHADLFAACLDAGMPVGPALRAASSAMAVTGFPGPGSGGRGDNVPGDARSGGRTPVPRGSALDRRMGTNNPAVAYPPARGGSGRGDSWTSVHSPPLAALEAVAAMLALGANPDIAWRAADPVEELVTLAAAARRSAAGGGRLADAVREHASLLRADQAAADRRAAGRAGVLMTAPLGICFLPAFLCLGLAPVIVGLLGQLDIF